MPKVFLCIFRFYFKGLARHLGKKPTFVDNNLKQIFMGRRLLLTVGLMMSLCAVPGRAEESPRWLRQSAISPDGKSIAFCYKGDVYVVATGGGMARQLTTNEAYDCRPVWSPDSKQIAFGSTREGSMDVFLMPVSGGTPRRLTTHSGSETPVAFYDAEHVLFASAGTPTPTDIQFPSGTFYHIYKVSTRGGRPELFSELTMGELQPGPRGELLYSDVKGYECPWRKHHTSSIARDVWHYDGKNYTKLTSFKGEDRNPVWGPDGKSFYYLSEQDGTFNVYRRTLSAQTTDKQLTTFKGNPVRYLSASTDGTLCFGYDGELYTLRPGGKPSKVKVQIVRDEAERKEARTVRTSGVSQVAVSPKGKEIAFILDGDVYVTSLDYNTTKQITDTPERERTVDFAPDGRSLVYDSERNGVWQIYQTSLTKAGEKNFTYCTEMKEERLTDGKHTSFQPRYSPDGKSVAFLQNRTTLCVMTLSSKRVVTVMDGKYEYSYTDGDQDFAWSPDSKWLLTQYLGTGGWNIPDIALVRADGKGDIVNLTNSGYSDTSPRWVLDGKAMIFKSDRAGYRSHGSWGAEYDEYIMFFDTEAYERFRMNKEELALLDEKEKADKEAKEKAEKEAKEKAEKKKNDKEKDGKTGKKDGEKAKDDTKLLTFELDNLDDRVVRLTPYSTNLGDAVLNKDGSKLYYVAPHEGGSALWEQDLKEHKNQLKMKGMSWGRMHPDAELKNVYLAGGGQIKKLDLAGSRLSNVGFETFNTRRPAEQRALLFEHIWKQTKEKLYDPGMNGADWERLKQTYAAYLPHINNGYDFAEMASELLGELNVSHTGCRYGGWNWALGTGSLGCFFDNDYRGDGLKIKEVMAGSPLALKKKDITPGCIIEQINGIPVRAGEDYYPLLQGTAGRYTRLTIKNKGKTFDVTIKPISQGEESELLYKRWVRRNEQLVDSLSGGRLAYVHIKAMDGGSYHTLYKNLLNDKNRNRDAVVVDTRHNGGGWLHNDVCILLSGKRYVRYTPRGQFIGNDPYNRWLKPSCMLVCEDNYSNAHGTPWLYQQMGIGKLIGAPVPGTMTAVWWENVDGFVFGIPQVGSLDNNNCYLENQQLEPDIEVHNTPEDQLAGRDRQIERAVQELLKQK